MLPLPALTATSASLKRVELSTTADSASLLLTLSARAQPRSFALHGPERIVLDFRSVSRSRGLQLPARAGLVNAVRVGPLAGGGTRVVVQLQRGMPWRLIAASAAPGVQQWRLQLGSSDGAADSNAGDAVGVAAAPADAPSAVAARHAPHTLGRDIVVAVDAGHGGTDPGASGSRGTHEKDITLAIARRLAQAIDAEPGMSAVLTRDRDVFVPLRERMQKARAARADMLVSIHADAVRDREVDGASVYILSERGASSEAARWLAEQENAADLRGGISLADQKQDLASVLLNLSQSATIGSSVEAADQVLKALDAVGAIRRREVQQAGFLVLKAPDMPSMLVETAYISNPGEERKLRSDDYQQRLAGAIVHGVRGYFRQHPPDGTRYAAERGGVYRAPISLAQRTP